MKSMILVALALVAAAAAAPADVKEVLTLRYLFDQEPEGSYRFGYENDDGTSRKEEGKLKEALDEDNKPHAVVVVRGSYAYLNADGSLEKIEYVADESGYHPEGPSIPKPARR